MQTYEIIELIGFILTIIALILKIVSQKTKNEKLLKLQKIVNEMQVLCQEAENMSRKGAEKKQYVLAGIEYLCGKSKVDYDKDFWSSAVDEFIEKTKSININKK